MPRLTCAQSLAMLSDVRMSRPRAEVGGRNSATTYILVLYTRSGIGVAARTGLRDRERRGAPGRLGRPETLTSAHTLHIGTHR
eukprot:2825919-Prymnesium_polylepis.2